MPDPALTPARPTRRAILQGVAAVAVSTALRPVAAPVVPIALSDLGVGLRQQLGIFPLAATAGYDGSEVDMGRLGRGPGLQTRLGDAAGGRAFTDAAQTAGVAIAAVHLSAFLQHRLATDPRAEAVLTAWVDAIGHTAARVGTLTIGPADDLADAATRHALADRLRPIALRAAEAGHRLVVDAPNAADTLPALLDAVAEPALTAAVRYGPAAPAAIRRLGLERVGQLRLHMADQVGVSPLPRSHDWNGWTVVACPIASADSAVEQYAAVARRIRTT